MKLAKLGKWWVWLPLGLAAAVGLYALLGFWAVPRLLRSQADDYARTHWKEPLSLGEIRFNPFTFQLDVRDVRIGQAQRPLIALRHAFVDLELSSLWHREYTFDRVLLEAPYAHALIRPDGSLNLADLYVEPEDPDAPPPAVLVRRLEVSGGRIDFADHSRVRKPEKTLAPIRFHLDNFRTTAEGGRFQLQARSEKQEQVRWEGSLGLRPVASQGRLSVQGLRMQTVDAFVGDALPVALGEGRIDLEADYRASIRDGHGLDLQATLPRILISEPSLRARDEKQDSLHLGSVTVENTRVSLSERSARVDAIRLAGLRTQAWRNADGSLSLDRYLPPSATASGSAVTPAANDWKVEIARLALTDGDVRLEDRSVRPAARFHLKPLTATLRELSLDDTRAVPLELSAGVNGHASLTLSGSVLPATSAAQLDLGVTRLPLADVIAYLPALPGTRIEAGSVDAKGQLKLRGSDERGPALRFQGEGVVSGFRLAETRGPRDVLSWQRVEARGLDYTMAPDALKATTVIADRAIANLAILPDGSINLMSLLGGEPVADATAAPIAPSSTQHEEMPIRVGTLALKNTTLGFADYSIDPNFRATIEALNGQVLGISTATDSVAKIDLKGHIINRYSPVTIQGETNIWSYDRHTDVRMAFRNIDLPIFNPYSGRFAGYAIAKGKLSTELHYRIDDRALAAEHHVIIDQLTWGQATDSQEKVTWPIRLATALLKDRNGLIDLNLPITGTLDDPKFRIGPIVWQVLKNTLVKVVTAPFSFLGSLFKGSEQAQFVDFAPASAELSEGARGNLTALAAALEDKTELSLDIPSGPSQQADAQAIGEQKFVAALLAVRKKNDAEFDYATLEPKARIDLLEALYRQDLGEKPKPPETETGEAADRAERKAARQNAEISWFEDALKPRYAASESELSDLARKRAAAVQEALLADGKIDPTRVFLSTNLAVNPGEQGARMELQLR